MCNLHNGGSSPYIICPLPQKIEHGQHNLVTACNWPVLTILFGLLALSDICKPCALLRCNGYGLLSGALGSGFRPGLARPTDEVV
jgi:hypothetical protein